MREKSLRDYGITAEDEEKLKIKVKNLSEIEREHLVYAALSSCDPLLAVSVIRSIEEGLSYDKLNKKQYIPALPDDFYGYRRKTIATFYDRLRLFGLWEDLKQNHTGQ